MEKLQNSLLTDFANIWHEMVGYKATYEDLEDLSLKDMTKFAGIYVQ